MLGRLTGLVPSPSDLTSELINTCRALAVEAGSLLVSMARHTIALAAPVLFVALWVWSAGAAACTYGAEWSAARLLDWQLDLGLARATILVTAGGLSFTLTPLCIALYLVLGYLERVTENSALARGIKAVLAQEEASAIARGAALRRAGAGPPP